MKVLNLLNLVLLLTAFSCEYNDPISTNFNEQPVFVTDNNINILKQTGKNIFFNKLVSVSKFIPARKGGTINLVHNSIDVLLVVRGDYLPSLHAQDAAKKALLESWGYSVDIIGDTESQEAFDAATASTDVAYVSEKIRGHILLDKLVNATIGVINEEPEHTVEYGFTSNYSSFNASQINITDNSHYITNPFNNSLLTFLSSPSTKLIYAHGTKGVDVLALAQNSAGYASLMVIEGGGQLWNGSSAAGRRVKLPWGYYGFDINLLNENGQKLMRRSIEWASGIGLTYANVSLEILRRAMSADAEISLAMETSEILGGVSVTFEPHGVTFSQPAILNIEVYGVDFTGVDPNAVDIYYDNPITGIWEPMAKEGLIINIETGYINVENAQLPHFSRYAIGME